MCKTQSINAEIFSEWLVSAWRWGCRAEKAAIASLWPQEVTCSQWVSVDSPAAVQGVCLCLYRFLRLWTYSDAHSGTVGVVLGQRREGISGAGPASPLMLPLRNTLLCLQSVLVFSRLSASQSVRQHVTSGRNQCSQFLKNKQPQCHIEGHNSSYFGPEESLNTGFPWALPGEELPKPDWTCPTVRLGSPPCRKKSLSVKLQRELRGYCLASIPPAPAGALLPNKRQQNEL